MGLITETRIALRERLRVGTKGIIEEQSWYLGRQLQDRTLQKNFFVYNYSTNHKSCRYSFAALTLKYNMVTINTKYSLMNYIIFHFLILQQCPECAFHIADKIH